MSRVLDCLEIDALLEMPPSDSKTGALPYWNKAAEKLVIDGGYAQVTDKPRWRSLPNYKRTPKGDMEARRLMR